MDTIVWGYDHMPTASAMAEIGATDRRRYTGVPDIACTPGNHVLLVIAEHKPLSLHEAVKLSKLDNLMLFERHKGGWARFKVSFA